MCKLMSRTRVFLLTRNLAQKDYLSYVTSLDKIYNKEKASYTLGEPFKIYKFNKRVMVIIIFLF